MNRSSTMGSSKNHTRRSRLGSTSQSLDATATSAVRYHRADVCAWLGTRGRNAKPYDQIQKNMQKAAEMLWPSAFGEYLERL